VLEATVSLNAGAVQVLLYDITTLVDDNNLGLRPR
jgi:hypothetical protein